MKIFSIYFFIFVLFIPIHVSSFTVHVLGDSHAFFCFNNTQSGITADEMSTFHYVKDGKSCSLSFYIHWLGSRTMHRVGRDGLSGLNIKRFGVKEGDVVVFLFGEVDVRCHIGKQRDQFKRSQAEVIQTLASNYLRTIYENKRQYKNITCIVASVTPPCDRGYNPSYPFYGPLQDRVRITQELNEALSLHGQRLGIHFLDIYSMYAQEDGSLGVALSDGIVHISPRHNGPIKEKLVDILIENNMIHGN